MIEIFNPDAGATEHIEIPMLLASDLLAAIARRNCKNLWDTNIGATSESCACYWELAAEEWASMHPVVQQLGRVNPTSV